MGKGSPMKKILLSQKKFQKKDKNSLWIFLSCLYGMICVCSVLLFIAVPTRTVPFSSALAKGSTIETAHNSITDAALLSKNEKYSDRIPAYDSAFYQIGCFNGLKIHILSNQIKSLSPKVLNGAGNAISIKKETAAGSLTITPKDSSKSKSDYLFLHIRNNTFSDISLQLFYEKGYVPQKKEDITDAQEKKTAHTKVSTLSTDKKSTKQTTSPRKSDGKKVNINQAKQTQSPKRNSSIKSDSRPQKTPESSHTPAAQAAREKKSQKPFLTSKPVRSPKTPTQGTQNSRQEIWLKPHFVRLKCGRSKTLVLSKTSFSKNDFTWICTSPRTVTVDHGKLTAENEGIAIIYIQHKSITSLRSSAFIKVTK